MNPIRKSMFNGQVSITRNVKRTCGGVKTINKNGAIKTSMFNGFTYCQFTIKLFFLRFTYCQFTIKLFFLRKLTVSKPKKK